MEVIQSRENQILKDIRKLKEKKYRDEKGKFFIEGSRFVEEALKANAGIDKVIISEKYISKYKDFFASTTKTPQYIVKESLFQDICSTETPQGIAAVVFKPNYELKDRDGLFVLVDKIQDPGNFGTIVRTAHAVGAKGIIYTSGTVDPFNDKTLRSTMGSVFYMPIIEDKNLSIIQNLRNKGYSLVVSSLEAQENFFDLNYEEKVIIAVGNEGKGISEEVASMADVKVKIPMPGGAESLNASVAASIMIYEVLRQNLK